MTRVAVGAFGRAAARFKRRAATLGKRPPREEDEDEDQAHDLPKISLPSRLLHDLRERARAFSQSVSRSREVIALFVEHSSLRADFVVNVDGDVLQRRRAFAHAVDVSIVFALHRARRGVHRASATALCRRRRRVVVSRVVVGRRPSSSSSSVHRASFASCASRVVRVRRATSRSIDSRAFRRPTRARRTSRASARVVARRDVPLDQRLRDDGTRRAMR